MESLPPSWIVKITEKTDANGSVKNVRSYFNDKTGQTFYTPKDLNRYVNYVKEEIPEVFAAWTTDGKDCKYKQKSKKKEVTGTSKDVPKMPLNKKKRAKPEPAPNALVKKQLLENGHKGVIVYSRKRKTAVAEAVEIPASSPPAAESKDQLSFGNIDFIASLAPDVKRKDQILEMAGKGVLSEDSKWYIEVDSDSNALLDQVWEECDRSWL